MGLQESLPRVVLDVLGHLLVCVETDLVQASSLSLYIGKAKEGSPDSGALRLGEDGNVVDVEVVLIWPQHDEPHQPFIKGGNVDNPAIDEFRVVVEHGCRRFAHSLDIRGVGRVDAVAHTGLIYPYCPTNLDSRGASHARDVTARRSDATSSAWSLAARDASGFPSMPPLFEGCALKSALFF